MKRLIAGGLLLLLVAFVALTWWQDRSSLLASQIAPADCLVYVELPNLTETAKRWPETALCQIFGESSVQRFLKQPISKTPANYQNAWSSFTALHCSALFFGVTDFDRSSWICGLQTSVDQPIWRHEITNICQALFGQNIQEVAPKNLVSAGPDEGGTGKAKAQIFCVRIGSWTMVSRNTGLLLDAVRNLKMTSGGLQSLKLFKECISNVPTGYDLLAFVQGGPSVNSSSGLHWRFGEQETQGSVRAVLATTTIDGARLRDTVYTLTDEPSNATPLEQRGLAMTSSSTIGYLASHVGLSEIWRWCDQLSEESPVAETIRNYMGQAKSFGIDPQDLDNLVSGTEIIVNHDPNSESLSAVILLRVTDSEKFQRLIDQVVTEKFPDRCRKIQLAAVPTYLMQVNNRVSIVFGLAGRELLIAGSESIFAELVRRLQSHAPGLESNDRFKAVAKLVGEPNDLFVYLDAKSGFERFYEASRPMLVFGIAVIPALSRYIDAMALPETGEISKHLGPIVLSRHRVAHGVVDESVGTITAYQTVALLLGCAVVMGLCER